MEIKIDVEHLRKQKLFLGLPMYGGVCYGNFARSLSDLTAMCAANNIPIQIYYLFNESLITRARNYCVDEFLRSDCTHMMFIDSDVSFRAIDVITLLQLQQDDSDYDVIGAAYPKKCISWEKIKLAVDKGFGDENPTDLERFVGDYVFNPIVVDGKETISLLEPAQVGEMGTGFMMIKRSVFAQYKETYPQFSYLPDHPRTDSFDGSREIHAYFDCIIDPVSKRYLSEDYMFCTNVRKMGGKIWICPWMPLTHTGTYVFGGTLSDIANIGAHATVGQGLKRGDKKK